MDLAYRELPPADTPPDEAELKTLMSRVTMVLARETAGSESGRRSVPSREPSDAAGHGVVLFSLNCDEESCPARLCPEELTFQLGELTQR